ncbi:MAG: hypothetical protein ACYDAB_00965 [bacterium]
MAALNHHDKPVTGAGGIALRYSGFYSDDNVLVAAVQIVVSEAFSTRGSDYLSGDAS